VTDTGLSESRKRLIRFGAIGALCVVIAGGALVFFDRPGEPLPTTSPAAAASASTAARSTNKTAAAAPAAARQDSSPGDPVVPTDAQNDQIRGFIADARRQAAAGNFAEAQALLQNADKVIPDLPATAQARSDIAAMATPQGQLATQLARAGAAIGQNDSATAEKALAEAERINPQAPEIAELRQTLQTAQQKETRRNDRITALLATMREAIARHDLAAADGALNEAERIDLQNPSVRQARVELSRAQNAGLKNETQN
jgi:tetratricopeptide (TPR) repeat protein